MVELAKGTKGTTGLKISKTELKKQIGINSVQELIGRENDVPLNSSPKGFRLGPCLLGLWVFRRPLCNWTSLISLCLKDNV